MLKKIALTGGVASGKTTVCQMFEELGATVVYADKIAHELLNPNTETGEKILHEFGSLDRKALSEKVFKDLNKLQKLESILHPAVLRKIDEEYKKAKGVCFIAEIPLLFEIGAENHYDIIIAVLADPAIAKKRFQKGEYELRMQRQIKPEIKAAKSHFVIQNNGSLEDLHEKVMHLWTSLQHKNS